MLPIRFHDIGSDDILRLVENKSSERKTLEYKQVLKIGQQEERAEFLADISSFANASGGDIIFGVSEERDERGEPTGAPKEVMPLRLDNAAKECARIEEIISSGIQPRIPVVEVKTIQIPAQGSVIVVRIGKSWIAPHMVSFANRTRFFSRNSTGKVQLDVQQIGAAFALQRGLGERLRGWKTERIAKAIAGEGPIPLTGSQMLLHFASAAALTSDSDALPRTFDSKSWGRAKSLIRLTPQFSRYNADGLLLSLDADSKSGKQSYLQVFKDGRLEYGDSYQMNSESRAEIPGALLEEAIVRTFGNAMELLKILAVSEPLFISLTLVGMKGKKMALPFDPSYFTFPYLGRFDRDVIVCPDVRVENIAEGSPYPTTLLPIINSMWQAAGLEQSPFISPDGNWNVCP